jgi:hypothetical protein
MHVPFNYNANTYKTSVMKNLRRFSVISSCSFLVGLILASSIQLYAQVKYRAEDLVVNVNGNSSAGEWQIKTNKGQLEAVFGLNGTGKITSLYTLWFTVECATLKSGAAAMEKNAYKALKANDNETINFVLKSSKIKEIVPGTYEVTCTGFLTIAGVEKETELIVNCVVNEDKTFTCSGLKKLKLSDFAIKFPSSPANSIQPADDISIAYNVKMGRM